MDQREGAAHLERCRRTHRDTPSGEIAVTNQSAGTARRTHVDLVKHGDSAAEFYMDKPGLFGPRSAVDLYHCIADLAREIKELRAALEKSRG
jgi:hypothetical protein